MTKQEALKTIEELKKYIDKIDNKLVKMTIKEQNLEWGATSEEELNWDEAREWCKKQGEGWRLPTRLELLEAYEQKIKGFATSNCFATSNYWSSTESHSYSAWSQNFLNGSQDSNYKNYNYYVRCIRSI